MAVSAQLGSRACRPLVPLILTWEGRIEERGKQGREGEAGRLIFVPSVKNFVCGSPFKYY